MYYKLHFATQKIGERYPQILKLRKGADTTMENCVTHLIYPKFYFEFPLFQPDFTCIEIAKGTVFTDVMSADLCGGLVISEKVKNILENFNIPPKHKFYPIQLIDFKNQIHEYYWFHLLEPSIETEEIDGYIDYSLSNFFSLIGMRYKVFRASSLDDFKKREVTMQKKYKNFYYANGKDIQLKKEIEYDIFRLFLYAPTNTFVSQKLYDALKEQNITGIEMLSSSDTTVSPTALYPPNTMPLHPPSKGLWATIQRIFSK